MLNNDVQVAIWDQQNQSLAGITVLPGTDASLAAYQADMNAAAAAAHVDVNGNADGAFGVYALNLYTGSGQNVNYAQPQLVAVPEVSTVLTGSLLVLSFGVCSLRSFGSKTRA